MFHTIHADNMFSPLFNVGSLQTEEQKTCIRLLTTIIIQQRGRGSRCGMAYPQLTLSWTVENHVPYIKSVRGHFGCYGGSNECEHPFAITFAPFSFSMKGVPDCEMWGKLNQFLQEMLCGHAVSFPLKVNVIPDSINCPPIDRLLAELFLFVWQQNASCGRDTTNPVLDVRWFVTNGELVISSISGRLGEKKFILDFVGVVTSVELSIGDDTWDYSHQEQMERYVFTTQYDYTSAYGPNHTVVWCSSFFQAAGGSMYAMDDEHTEQCAAYLRQIIASNPSSIE